MLVSRYGVRNIKIADEMFVLNRRHVSAICDGIIERGYDLNLWAYARVDTVKEGMLDKLRAAGFRWLAFGIEAASDEVRGAVDKSFDQDLIYSTLDKVRRAGIHVIGNYIFGLPDDDLDSMHATLDLALGIELRIRQFLLDDGLPGVAFVRDRAESSLAAARVMVGLLATLRRFAPAADQAPCGRGSLAVPRRGVPAVFRQSRIFRPHRASIRTGDRAGNPANDLT